MVAHHSHITYTANRGVNLGKTWLMNRASRVEVAACRDGKAPKTMGEAVKPEV